MQSQSSQNAEEEVILRVVDSLIPNDEEDSSYIGSVRALSPVSVELEPSAGPIDTPDAEGAEAGTGEASAAPSTDPIDDGPSPAAADEEVAAESEGAMANVDGAGDGAAEAEAEGAAPGVAGKEGAGAGAAEGAGDEACPVVEDAMVVEGAGMDSNKASASSSTESLPTVAAPAVVEDVMANESAEGEGAAHADAGLSVANGGDAMVVAGAEVEEASASPPVAAPADVEVEVDGGDGGLGAAPAAATFIEDGAGEENEADADAAADKTSEGVGEVDKGDGEEEEEKEKDNEEDEDKEEDDKKESEEEEKDDVAAPPPKKLRRDPAAGGTLGRLLCVARDVPQLGSALFALNEWAARAASRNDVEKYFLGMKRAGEDGGKAGPLRIAIRRVLLCEPGNGPEDPSALIDGCANLIATVLLGPACSVVPGDARNEAHSSDVKRVLGELLTGGQDLAFQMSDSLDGEEGATPEEVAENLSGCVLEVLRRACKERRAHERRLAAARLNGHSAPLAPRQAGELVRLLEGEVDALASKRRVPSPRALPKGNVPPISVLDLLANRDRTKAMAERSGAVLEVSLGQRRGGSKKGATQANGGKEPSQLPQPQFEAPAAKLALVRKIAGPSLYDSIAASLVEVQSLEGEIAKRRAETSSARGVLASRQEAVSTERKEVNARMEQLRKELEELEKKDEQLAKEESAVKLELGQLEATSKGEVKALEGEAESKAGHVAADHAVRMIADKVGELELAWVRTFAFPPAPSAAVTDGHASGTAVERLLVAPLAPLKLDQYLQFAQSYFRAEAQSAEVLRERIAVTEARDGVAEEAAAEDAEALRAMQDDAGEARRALLRRVEAYCAAAGGEAGVLRASHALLLEGISVEAAAVGLDDADGGMGGVLSRVRHACRAAPPRPAPSSRRPRAGDTADPKGTTGGRLQAAAPRSMPKYSWANKASGARKRETRSLLDIQKEEMSQRERRS